MTTPGSAESIARFSPRHPLVAWTAIGIPAIAAGVYAIWSDDELLYCGMSGRQIEKARNDGKRKFGLVTRLASHASGRLSGDQFCVYVANRLVLPSLPPEVLPKFGTGEVNLDALTRRFIHERLDVQVAMVESSSAAYSLERDCRTGRQFGVKPSLNPL